MAEITQAKPSRWASAVKKTKKVLQWIMSLIIISLVIFVYFKYFFTYSEGYRAGLLQKFSNKGVVFKTYEGELILSSVSSTANVALASEKFIFSVMKKNVSLQYDTLQGKNVIVHYIEKKGTVPWRGDSRYLVDSIALRK
ncbi:MAG TPA: hypothetical protein DEO60_04425 [Bacteroidales bacterium]|nr:hypothetical protein [Bacteroidales bacterium]HBZ20353.1 hypothetical protein [Bacteroidales bacterium]